MTLSQRHAAASELDRFKQDLTALLPRLRRYARSLAHNQSDADDLVQETCLKAIANYQSWDPAQPLDRWSFRIMRNLWISDLRRNKVRSGEGTIPAEESNELVTQEGGEQSVMFDQLHRTLRELPAEMAEVLLLVSAEGYSYKEAAEALGIPVGTVMSRIFRGRKILAEKLNLLEVGA